MAMIDQDLDDIFFMNCMIITLISILHLLSHVELLFKLIVVILYGKSNLVQILIHKIKFLV